MLTYSVLKPLPILPKNSHCAFNNPSTYEELAALPPCCSRWLKHLNNVHIIYYVIRKAKPHFFVLVRIPITRVDDIITNHSNNQYAHLVLQQTLPNITASSSMAECSRPFRRRALIDISAGSTLHT